MSDFANLVKRINEIGASQAPSEKDVITESNTPYNKTAEESVTGTSETLSLLKVIDEINGEKIKESEDIIQKSIDMDAFALGLVKHSVYTNENDNSSPVGNNNSNIKIITIDIIVQLLIINKKSSIIQDIQYIVFFI